MSYTNVGARIFYAALYSCNSNYTIAMDVRVSPEPAVATAKPDRRELAREAEHDRPLPPAVVVELGRTPESAGTYSARGVLEPKGPVAKEAPAAAAATAEPRVSAPRAEAAGTSNFTAPEAAPVATSAHVQVMANASTELGAALRAKVGAALPQLQAPSQSLVAGIQALATNALKQPDRGHAAAEHEDDPLREEEREPEPRTERAGQRSKSGSRA